MSIENTNPLADSELSSSQLPTPLSGVLTKLERAGEWCSSILVKEARQAIKSRHFLWTYFVLLAAVGLVAVVGITLNTNDIQNSNGGLGLLFAFFIVLGFPLGIVIPFSAYRSVAKEFEDGTIELISITTMKPYQIIAGKFGSAILQMLVYLAVLAPCILFTYLLRGISLEQILFGLVICIGFSICLTILGLFLAGAIRSRAWGVGVSVVFVLLLGWAFWLWCVFLDEFLLSSMRPPFNDPDFFFAMSMMFALLGSTAGLLWVTAVSQISFQADNRSTNIRWMMVLQQTLFLGFVVGFCRLEFSTYFDEEFWLVMAFIAGHYWLLMEFLMIGESPNISRRVQRKLPQSILGRSLLSFLMPGPGRGFLFAQIMMWSCGLSLTLALVLHDWYFGSLTANFLNNRGTFATGDILSASLAILTCCIYVSAFLSISYLFARGILHRHSREWATGVGPTLNLLLGFLIVIVPTLMALVLQFSLFKYPFQNEYSAFQIFNWYWTITEIIDGNPSDGLVWLLLAIVPAGVVIGWASLKAATELLQQPIPVPKRVQIDQQKSPVKLPVGESIDEIFGEV